MVQRLGFRKEPRGSASKKSSSKAPSRFLGKNRGLSAYRDRTGFVYKVSEAKGFTGLGFRVPV